MNNYFEWKDSESTCRCGWSGPNTEIKDMETFAELFEYFCPTCHEKLGIVSYPSLWQVQEAAERGNPEAMHMWQKFTSATPGEDDG